MRRSVFLGGGFVAWELRRVGRQRCVDIDGLAVAEDLQMDDLAGPGGLISSPRTVFSSVA